MITLSRFVDCSIATQINISIQKERQKLQILLANFDSELQRITGN